MKLTRWAQDPAAPESVAMSALALALAPVLVLVLAPVLAPVSVLEPASDLELE
jgi:hypothetical protein